MKLHLPIHFRAVILVAHMAFSVCTARAASYIAEGIDVDNTNNSTLFFDNGKGYYWTWSKLLTPAKNLYTQTGSSEFLGDLTKYLVHPESQLSNASFANLSQDSNTCGRQVPANQIQYWLRFYGVFYKGSETLPYGYTYDKKYLDDLGATQSLKVGMFLHDNWKNEGNSLASVGRWFFSDREASGLLNNHPDKGGFFKEYFSQNSGSWEKTAPIISWIYVDAAQVHQYANYRENTIRNITTDLFKGFGINATTKKQMVRGSIVFLGLNPDSGSAGHAITCYGFETGADGNVSLLYVCNSDDAQYKLFPLYTKVSNGLTKLYTDAACTKLWVYARDTWSIGHIEYINTPQVLQDMLAEYEKEDNPLIWNGQKTTWSASDANIDRACFLPNVSDGWSVAVGGDMYASFFELGRPVEFSDTGTASCNISVSGTISVPALRLTASKSATCYTYSSASGATIHANQLYLSGKGNYCFDNVNLSVQTISDATSAQTSQLSFIGSTFSCTSDYTFTKGALKVKQSHLKTSRLVFNSGSSLYLDGENTLTGSLVLNNGATLTLNYSGSTLLTATGTLEWNGSIAVNPLNLDETGMYTIVKCANIQGDLNSLKIAPSARLYSWSISGDALVLSVARMSTTLSENNPLWKDGVSNFFNDADMSVVIDNGRDSALNISISGTVTPHDVEVRGNNDITMSDATDEVGIIAGNAKLTKNGASTLTINTANSYTGGTIINNGTVATGCDSALGTGEVKLCGGILDLANQKISNNITIEGETRILRGKQYAGALTLNGGTLSGDALRLNRSATLCSGTIYTPMTGTGGVSKTTSGRVYIYGDNSYTGGTTISGGTLVTCSPTALGSGTVQLLGGTLDTTHTDTLTATALTLNGGTLVTSPGTINISGTLNISGQTRLSLGALDVGEYAILNATSYTGSLDLLLLDDTDKSYTWSFTNDVLSLYVDEKTSENVVIPVGNRKNISYTESITGNARVEMNGTGILTLTKANSYRGGTTIKSGTLVAGADGALGRGDVTLHGGKLDIGGHALTDNKARVKDVSHVAAGNGGSMKSLDLSTPGVRDGDGTQLFGGVLTLTGTLELDSLKVGTGAVSGGSLRVHKSITAEGGTIAANLSGTATFTKSGRGTLTLLGRNNRMGRTTINEGRLVIAGQSTVSSLYFNGGSLAVTRSGSLTVTDVFSVCGNDMELSSPITLNTTMDGNLLDLLRANGCEAQNENGAIVFSPGTPVAPVAMLLADTAEETGLAEDTGMTEESADVVGDEAVESSGGTADGKATDEAVLAAEEPAPAVGTDALAQSTWGVAKAARLFADTVRDHAGLGSAAALNENGTRSAWFSTMSSFSRTDSNGVAAGADTDIYGGALGMQFNGSRGGNAGIAVGQSWGHISPMGGSSRVTQKTQHAALYANKVLVNRERDFANVSATAAYATTDSDTVQDGHRFDWAQQSAVLGLRGTWVHHISNATAVYCYTGAEYLATDSADTENGESGSVQSLKWEAGAGVSHTAGKLTVYADAAFRPDIVRHNPVAESDRQRGGVSNPGRLELRATVGADYRVDEHWSINAGYSYEGAARENNHNLRAGVGYTF